MIDKKELGNRLCDTGFSLFQLGYNYGLMNTKYNLETIRFKIRQKIFFSLDSFMISKEDEIKEAEFEAQTLLSER